MLIDMQVKGFDKTTQEAYLKCMYNFIKFHKIPPDKITIRDIYLYQVNLVKHRKVSYCYFNQTVCAMRFFYTYTIKMNWNIELIRNLLDCSNKNKDNNPIPSNWIDLIILVYLTNNNLSVFFIELKLLNENP